MTAQRLCGERAEIEEKRFITSGHLSELVRNQNAPPYARVQALWTRRLMAAAWATKRLPDPTPVFLTLDLEQATHDPSPAVRKAAFQIIAEDAGQIQGDGSKLMNAALPGLHDSDPRGAALGHSGRERYRRPLACRPWGRCPRHGRGSQAGWPVFGFHLTQNCTIHGWNRQWSERPRKLLWISSRPRWPPPIRPRSRVLVRQLSSQLTAKADPALSSTLVILLAQAPAKADALKQILLKDLAKAAKAEAAPAWSTELQKALQSLLASHDPGVSAAALPLIASCDKSGVMAGDLKGLVQKLSARVE